MRQKQKSVPAPALVFSTPESGRLASAMSGNGYGAFDRVQAPETLITAFLRRTSSMA
jgi:hypothetical protein